MQAARSQWSMSPESQETGVQRSGSQQLVAEMRLVAETCPVAEMHHVHAHPSVGAGGMRHSVWYDSAGLLSTQLWLYVLCWWLLVSTRATSTCVLCFTMVSMRSTEGTVKVVVLTASQYVYRASQRCVQIKACRVSCTSHRGHMHPISMCKLA